jgi:hypothetical protein
VTTPRRRGRPLWLDVPRGVGPGGVPQSRVPLLMPEQARGEPQREAPPLVPAIVQQRRSERAS